MALRSKPVEGEASPKVGDFEGEASPKVGDERQTRLCCWLILRPQLQLHLLVNAAQPQKIFSQVFPASYAD